MRHIIRPLLRHRLMPLLVMLQVALACAIACNALFLLQQRLVPILAPDGIGHPERLVVAWNIASRGKPWPPSRLREVEATLRALPGVEAASISGSMPMETNAQMNGDVVVDGSSARADTAIYIGDHLRQALELRLVAGRDFTAAEEGIDYQDVGINTSGPTIITRALANRLFPDGNALGKVIRIGQDADAARRTVVGVVAHLMRNKLEQDNRSDIDYSMLFPGVPGQWPMPVFTVRAGPAVDTERVREATKLAIQHELGAQMIQGFDATYQMYAGMRANMLAKSRAAVWLGLTSYWVQQRTRQIGIRRALGARRADILRQVQLENLLVVGTGVAAGMLLAYAVNLWLMQHYELSRLPWTYLPIGAVLMLVLGQLAVLCPALRAAAVPPVVATRSV